MIDIRKKLQDKANEIVNEAIAITPEYSELPNFDNFLKELVSLSMQKGYAYGVTSMKQTAEYLLNDLKGERVQNENIQDK